MPRRHDPMRNALAALLLVALTGACSDGTGRDPYHTSPGRSYDAADTSGNATTIAAVAAIVGLLLLLAVSDDSKFESGTLEAG